MLINLSFVKASNGLFYFALDYIAELLDDITIVLVRTPEMKQEVQRRFTGLKVDIAGSFSAALRVRRAAAAGEMVFTPSSHPIPWCDRQLVILHDTYPFRGIRGRVKKHLFLQSLGTSSARVGYVNKADSRHFLELADLPDERLVSAPNRISVPSRMRNDPAVTPSSPPIVGLFGTDSPKKNYDSLFAAILKVSPSPRLRIMLYGQGNSYVAALIRDHEQLDISIINSSDVGLETFVNSVDLVASAATAEGFSRPVALGLASGSPAWLVESPVIREYYDVAAGFFPDPQALGEALSRLSEGTPLARPVFDLPDWIERDFRACVTLLKTMEHSR